MATTALKQAGLAAVVALLAATSFAAPSQAWHRCFACGGGAFAAGAIAGAALANPYYAPRYVYPAPAYAPYPYRPYYPPYAACPVVGPLPYYCR